MLQVIVSFAWENGSILKTHPQCLRMRERFHEKRINYHSQQESFVRVDILK